MLPWELPHLPGAVCQAGHLLWSRASPPDSHLLLERPAPSGLQPVKKLQETDLQPALCLVCVSSPAGSSATVPPGSVRAGEEGACGPPGLLLRVWPLGLLGRPCPLPPALLQQPLGLQEVRPGHCLAGPSSAWTPHLSRLFPHSSWPGVGRAPRRTALLPVVGLSFSACLPVCSLQSCPVVPALFRVLLLTRADGRVLCQGLSPPGTALGVPLPPSRRCFWMIPEEGLRCPPPWECAGALPRCRAWDADSAGCPGLTLALCPQLPGVAGVCSLASWVLFPELKWCLVKPSPSRAAGGQQAGENVPGVRGGVPFSQRTQGAHSGRERLHVRAGTGRGPGSGGTARPQMRSSDGPVSRGSSTAGAGRREGLPGEGVP